MEENKDEKIQNEEVKSVPEEQTTAVVNEVQSNESTIKGNDKKSKSLVPILIVLIIIILGLCGYIAYDKIFADKNNKEQETEQKEEEQETKINVNINDETVQKLFNTFRGDKFRFISELASSNLAKLRFVYESIPKDSFETILCTKVFGNFYSMGSLGFECGYGLDLNNSIEDPNDTNLKTKAIPSSLMKSKIEEYFGSDYSYKAEYFGLDKTEIEPFCAIMLFHKESDYYAYYAAPCGGTTGEHKEELTSAYKEGDKLVLTSKTTVVEDMGQKYYPNETHTYEFKKDAKNGNYVFVNYKKIDE